MPLQKTAASLAELSGLAACRYIQSAVCAHSPISRVSREPDTDDSLGPDFVHLPVCVAFEQICGEISRFLQTTLPTELLTDLANVYLRRIHEPSKCAAERVSHTLDSFTVVYVLLNCGLKAVSFEGLQFSTLAELHQLPNAWNGTRALLLKSLLRPANLTRLQKLDLSGMVYLRGPDFDAIFAAVARWCTELVDINLDCLGFIDENIVKYFVPGKKIDGSFQANVPCPRLKYFSVHHTEVDLSGLADLLLTHRSISFFGYYWMDQVFDHIQENYRERFPAVYDSWRSKLTCTKVFLTDGIGTPDNGNRGRMQKLTKVFVSCPWLKSLHVNLRDLYTPCLDLFVGNSPTLECLVLDFKHFDTVSLPSRMGQHAAKLLTSYGWKLSMLGIYSDSLKLSQLVVIGQSCPNVTDLRLLFGDFSLDGSAPPQGSLEASLFRNLKTLFLRIGHRIGLNSLSLSAVVPFLLSRSPSLENFSLETSQDAGVSNELVAEWVGSMWTPGIRTISLSGHKFFTEEEGHFSLTDSALSKLASLPRISRIGDIGCWSVGEDSLLSRKKNLALTGVDLELIWRRKKNQSRDPWTRL